MSKQSSPHRLSYQVIAIITYAALLAITALCCAADDAGYLAPMFAPEKMLPAVAAVALFHAIFITPILVQLRDGRSGKTSQKAQGRALRVAGATALWQLGLLAPFVALAVRLAPAYADRCLYVALLVAFHGMGAALAALMLGRIYILLAIFVTCAGPLVAFMIVDVGGREQNWLAMYSPFGQLAALTGFFDAPPNGLLTAVLLFAVFYACAVALRLSRHEGKME